MNDKIWCGIVDYLRSWTKIVERKRYLKSPVLFCPFITVSRLGFDTKVISGGGIKCKKITNNSNWNLNHTELVMSTKSHLQDFNSRVRLKAQTADNTKILQFSAKETMTTVQTVVQSTVNYRLNQWFSSCAVTVMGATPPPLGTRGTRPLSKFGSQYHLVPQLSWLDLTSFNFRTKICRSIIRKIYKITATRCQLLRLRWTKLDFGWGSVLDPTGGAYTRPTL